MWNSLRKLLGGAPALDTMRPAPPPDPEPESEPVVPEITTEELRAALHAEEPLLLLDVREEFEWRQGHLPTDWGWETRHIPMNSIPDMLEELPRERTIVVLCAHGSRSYGVTHYLIEQGFTARNLSGGITRWGALGGPITR